MKRTYVTHVQDRAGVFLDAARIISSNGGNIVRTSYNKSVDSRTMFLDVHAEDEATLDMITVQLRECGYLTEDESDRVMLVSLTLNDVPGAVIPVLEVLKKYDVNIPYMNSQENGTQCQHFKMALFLDNPGMTKKVLDEISEVCEVTVLDYEITDKVLDNTVFYLTFANQMKSLLSLNDVDTREITVCSNMIMQLLDDRGELPFNTFEYVYRFASFIQSHRGGAFEPECDTQTLGGMNVHMIQPPCGSSTYIVDTGKSLVFVDGGFACNADRLMAVAEKLTGTFDGRRKVLLLTHSDMDHIGTLPYFDEVYAAGSVVDDLLVEDGWVQFRERNPLHAPYYRISKIIAGCVVPNPGSLNVIGRRDPSDDSVYQRIGSVVIDGVMFNAFEGNGGHVEGDTVFECPSIGAVFTGDDYVNVKRFTKSQYEFNLLAPYLMQSVNMDSAKARICRDFLVSSYGGKMICPGHGGWLNI